MGNKRRFNITEEQGAVTALALSTLADYIIDLLKDPAAAHKLTKHERLEWQRKLVVADKLQSDILQYNWYRQ